MDADTDTPPEIDKNSSEVVDNLYYMHTNLENKFCIFYCLCIASIMNKLSR